MRCTHTHTSTTRRHRHTHTYTPGSHLQRIVHNSNDMAHNRLELWIAVYSQREAVPTLEQLVTLFFCGGEIKRTRNLAFTRSSAFGEQCLFIQRGVTLRPVPTLEELIGFAGVVDDRQELVGVALVRQGDVVAPLWHWRAELHWNTQKSVFPSGIPRNYHKTQQQLFLRKAALSLKSWLDK